MFVLKNALISIIRNKGRNVLIGVIILIIACASTITLAISNTASDLIESYVNAYEKEVTITFNRSNVMKSFNMSDENSREEAKKTFQNVVLYTIEDINSYAESDHIEDYYYIYNISLNGNNIEKASSSINNEEVYNRNNKGFGMESSIANLDFILNGYSSIESMSEFINGTYTITKLSENAWDIAFDGNYVFINEELAEYNSLKLNDKIVLEDEDGITYEFEIIGIFKDNSNEGTYTNSMFSNSVNTIVTNADVLIDIANSNDNIDGSVNATFIIDSYDNLEIVQDLFYEKGLDETYVLTSNEEVVKSSLSGVSNVNSFANVFLIITLVIGGTVLFIINMINIRERKYEIGVLRTIGISKSKLTMQFVSELLIVALVSICIGAGIGAIMSKNVSNVLLTNEIESSLENTEKIQNNFGNRENMGNINKMIGAPSVNAYDSINAVVDIKVILELLVIGLTLVLISSMSSMISIQRFSPLTILKERS